MAENPFEIIYNRLSKVEETNNLILGILKKGQKTESKEEKEELLTVDALADFLHLSKATIYSHFSKGLIPGGCKQSKRLYFDKRIIIDWIKSGRKLSNAEIEAESENYLNKKKGLNHG